MRASVSCEGYSFNRYFSDGCGEARLRAPHGFWRAPHARFQGIGGNHIALDAPRPPLDGPVWPRRTCGMNVLFSQRQSELDFSGMKANASLLV